MQRLPWTHWADSKYDNKCKSGRELCRRGRCDRGKRYEPKNSGPSRSWEDREVGFPLELLQDPTLMAQWLLAPRTVREQIWGMSKHWYVIEAPKGKWTCRNNYVQNIHIALRSTRVNHSHTYVHFFCF